VFKELTQSAVVVSHGPGDQNSAKFGAAITRAIDLAENSRKPDELVVRACRGAAAATPADAA
jgi:hypothetical protein